MVLEIATFADRGKRITLDQTKHSSNYDYIYQYLGLVCQWLSVPEAFSKTNPANKTGFCIYIEALINALADESDGRSASCIIGRLHQSE